MKKLSLKTKIGGGFGLVLFLLAVVSFISWRGIDNMLDGFISYQGLAKDNNLASHLQTEMLMMRMNVKDFIITGSSKDIEQYNHYLNLMDEYLEKARIEVQDPERAEKVAFISKEVAEYREAFEQVIIFKAERNQMVHEVLNVIGPENEQNLTAIMEMAENNGDVEIGFQAGMALRNLLLMRLYAVKFLDTNDEQDADRVTAEIREFDEHMHELIESVTNPRHQKVLKNIAEGNVEYRNTFAKLRDLINARNELIQGTLDRIGPEIAEAADEVRLSVKTEQDELGVRLQDDSHRSEFFVIVLAIIAFFFGSIFSILLTRTITKPVNRAVAFAENMARGDLSQSLEVNQHDEIGLLAKAMADMAKSLRAMFSDISSEVEVLSSSSTELTDISQAMASSAEQTSSKSTMVAASAEQMRGNMKSIAAASEEASTNVQMVAAASEQMSATINEIAGNTEKGRMITARAVDQAQLISGRVEELGKAATDVGKVTDTINEISDQTNLLALNATIEAARAGEAGKGFAVVANEIKNLAKQTAEATQDIRFKIESIQNSTDSTVTEIKQIRDVINEVNEIVGTISSAIEEQSISTREIAGNVNQAAQGIQDVNENVVESSTASEGIASDVIEVNQAAKMMADNSQQVDHSASELLELSQRLKQMIEQFKL